MKKLKDILYRVSIDAVRGNTDIDVTGLAFDSRKVEPGMVFIAQKGTQSDGHQFIGQAIAAGAKTVIYENEPIILKISGPNGMSFEPEQYILSEEGKNIKDFCSKDINFKFLGFSTKLLIRQCCHIRIQRHYFICYRLYSL